MAEALDSPSPAAVVRGCGGDEKRELAARACMICISRAVLVTWSSPE